MDDDLRKRLIDIKRLMENASTVGEAEAAAAAWQRMIFKHNLTDQDLYTLEGKPKESYGHIWVEVGPRNTPGLQWKLNLVRVVAEYNFCHFVRFGHHGGVGYLVGQPSNQESVREMFFATAETVERLGLSEWISLANNPQEFMFAGFPKATSWKNSFKLGFPDGLSRKMRLERKREVEENSNANAMILVKDRDLALATDKLFDDSGMKRFTQKESQATDSDGYWKGVEKGQQHSPQGTLGHGYKELGSGM